MKCSLPTCGTDASVHWLRRPSADELAAMQALQPDMTLTATSATVAVYACAQHGLSLDAASLVHQSTCAAPPTCGCTPEPVVTTPPPVDPTLPTGW